VDGAASDGVDAAGAVRPVVGAAGEGEAGCCAVLSVCGTVVGCWAAGSDVWAIAIALNSASAAAVIPRCFAAFTRRRFPVAAGIKAADISGDTPTIAEGIFAGSA